MDIDYDPKKRLTVLENRGLDLADAGNLFDGFHLTRRDDRHRGRKERWISVGQLGAAVVLVVWTRMGRGRRVITMWKVDARERAAYFRQRKRRR